MKIAFMILECESYALQLFSALLKERGHEVHFIFDPRLFATDEISHSIWARVFDIRRQNIRKIKAIDPYFVGFSVYTQDYQWSLSMARMIKKEIPDLPIIFGGIHPTLCPEQVIKEDCIDGICIGEGEAAIIEMAEARKNDWSIQNFFQIRNMRFKEKGFIQRNPLRPLIHNLDDLPFVDKEAFYKIRPLFKNGYTISTGRGCPYTCAFCASDALGKFYREHKLGNYVRQRSVTNVLNELTLAKALYKPKTIYFTDDVFTLNTEWLKEFREYYSSDIELPFYCTANPAFIKDEELYLLKEAGCQMIGFGMQSCNEEYRKTYLKRYGSNERIKEVAKLCHELGIHFSFDHIFDLPNEPKENRKEALEFYIQTRPDIINTFTMTYLPKIELNKYLDEKTKTEVENGQVRTSMFNRSNDNYNTLFVLLPLLPAQLFSYFITWRIRLPFWVRLFLKDLKRLMMGRYSDVFFPIQLFFINIWKNLKIKSVL